MTRAQARYVSPFLCAPFLHMLTGEATDVRGFFFWLFFFKVGSFFLYLSLQMAKELQSAPTLIPSEHFFHLL